MSAAKKDVQAHKCAIYTTGQVADFRLKTIGPIFTKFTYVRILLPSLHTKFERNHLRWVSDSSYFLLRLCTR